MKKIKHSKFKNTGFLFELLTRQITLEVLNNSQEKAKKIVVEFFGNNTELSKELRLFKLLGEEKYNSESKAEKFIDAILEARTKLDDQKLTKEKYNLVKAIKENFEIDSFLASPVTNYRVLASIHKLFEAKKSDISDVKDIFDSKLTLVEHISTSAPATLKQKEDNITTLEQELKQRNALKSLIDNLSDALNIDIKTDNNALLDLENRYIAGYADRLKRNTLNTIISNLEDVSHVNITTDPSIIEYKDNTLASVLDLQVKQDKLKKVLEICKINFAVE